MRVEQIDGVYPEPFEAGLRVTTDLRRCQSTRHAVEGTDLG